MAEKQVPELLDYASDHEQDPSSKLRRTIFVGGIPLKSTPKEIEEYLLHFDSVESVILPKNKKSGHLKGYAKVILASVSGVERVLNERIHTIGNLNIGVSRWTSTDEYLQKKGDLSARKVYVKFKSRLSRETIQIYFSQFGPIEQFDVKYNPLNGRFRDFGYITFSDNFSAQAAIKKHLHVINGETVRCELCKPNGHLNQSSRVNQVDGNPTKAQSGHLLKNNEDKNPLNYSKVFKHSTTLQEKQTKRKNTSGHHNTDQFGAVDKIGHKKSTFSPQTDYLPLPDSKSLYFSQPSISNYAAQGFKEPYLVPYGGNDRPLQPNRLVDPSMEKPVSKFYFIHHDNRIKMNHYIEDNLQFRVHAPTWQPQYR